MTLGSVSLEVDSANTKKRLASSTTQTLTQTPRKHRKPKKVLSGEAQRAKQGCDQHRGKTRVNIGGASDSWKEL